MNGIFEFVGNCLKSTYVELFLYLVLPAFLTLWLWKSKNRSKFGLLIKTAGIGTFILALFWVPYRETSIGYYTNYILLMLFLAAAVMAFMKVRGVRFFDVITIKGIAIVVPGIISILFMGYVSINGISGFFYDEKPIEMMFPLKNGAYAVIQGGNGASSYLANYHYYAWGFGTEEDTLNKFSTDIVKLNKLGFCFNTLSFLFNNDLPKDLSKYEMFSEPLYSPCEGEVWSVEDGNEDLKPSKNEIYAPSNNVVIKFNENYYVALHHLKRDSIKVAAGDKVKQGQLLGEIGNSGNTTIPHLHIQVWKNDGTNYIGVPIHFNGSFPVKNKVYFK
ncbi:M23 family metallopeptidase [Pseudobacteroides cellulosolvens]|uniref:Peptidase M23 n=1 Tax=Pseudobacteroides cellulosolvens ATCC 35603 = DSM 2933 TaxID=398512 RepID=A0A0L6JUI1_9FIRM|nr:M23 family metallopeptidase [Pseudobacteroides cellulosolvens]KNY29305.1 Peptidase M23 [Pseudobacteroides cellulosolvens ATCC 35603 = DSM 2933]